MKEISTVISKITRRNEKTYTIKRTLIGTTFLKDTPMNIEHTTLMIQNKPETVYRFRISYKSTAIKAGALSDFYLNNNKIIYYDNEANKWRQYNAK